MRDLKGRVAALTGAGSGIGRALALELAGHGCHLALSDIDPAGLAETARAIPAEAQVRVHTRIFDVADRAAYADWVDEVIREFSRVDLAIQNAGVGLAARVHEMTFEELDWLLGINLHGVLHGTMLFLPWLERDGGGHAVTLSSVFGIVAMPGMSAYNVAKFGVRGFTECLRQELALQGSKVSVTCVHPGGIRTEIATRMRLGSRRDVTAPGHQEIAEEFTRIARTSPEAAARKIVHGIRRNRRRVLIGPDAWLIDKLQRLLPTGYQRLQEGILRRRPLSY